MPDPTTATPPLGSDPGNPFAKYVPHAWQDYTNACWAANWHRFFEDDPTDARGKMGWPNRFQDALANAAEVFNYYSSGDSVFTEEEEAPSLSDGVVHWGLEWYLGIVPCPTVNFTLDNHSWQKQEVMKGAAKVGGTLSGGWGFNIWEVHDEDSDESWSTHYTPQGASAALADGSITNRPVFNVSDATELMNSSATEDDIFLALAKHVPALSSPVGGTRALKPDRFNLDLNSEDFRNGWGRNHPNFGTAWLHSDMKDMAYIYVYKLYDEIVNTKGSLK